MSSNSPGTFPQPQRLGGGTENRNQLLGKEPTMYDETHYPNAGVCRGYLGAMESSTAKANENAYVTVAFVNRAASTENDGMRPLYIEWATESAAEVTRLSELHRVAYTRFVQWNEA